MSQGNSQSKDPAVVGAVAAVVSCELESMPTLPIVCVVLQDPMHHKHLGSLLADHAQADSVALMVCTLHRAHRHQACRQQHTCEQATPITSKDSYDTVDMLAAAQPLAWPRQLPPSLDKAPGSWLAPWTRPNRQSDLRNLTCALVIPAPSFIELVQLHPVQVRDRTAVLLGGGLHGFGW